MDMLPLLVKTLGSDFENIKTAKNKEDHAELLRQIHKLHGAICYCDLPELRKKISSIETALKQHNYPEVTRLFPLFENDIQTILTAHQS